MITVSSGLINYQADWSSDMVRCQGQQGHTLLVHLILAQYFVIVLFLLKGQLQGHAAHQERGECGK